MRTDTDVAPEQPAARRRTQDERSAATIKKLLAATITLIAKAGFVNLTTTMIAERAGVSRGAMLHHFASKSALVKDATEGMWASVVEASDAMRDEPLQADLDTDALVEAVWTRLMTDTFVSVTIQMMTAARGDPELKIHVDTWMQRMFTSYREMARVVFGVYGMSDSECETLILVVTSALRGLRVAQMVEPDAQAAGAARDLLASLIRARLAEGKTQ